MSDESTSDSADDKSEIELFTEQARWLITYHENRSESLSGRAVALLGFSGVILALLLRGGLPKGVEVNALIGTAYVVTVAGLLLTAVACVMTVKSQRSQVPGVKQVRTNWKNWITKKRRGKVAEDIAETYLQAKHLDQDSVVDWAAHTANSRARWFLVAAALLGLSVLSLTVLLIAVGWGIL